MTSPHPILFTILFVLLVASVHSQARRVSEKDNSLPYWQTGYLDIHHINTGRGDATFLVMPDGTTMLFDAGDMDQDEFDSKWSPLKATALHPSDSLTAGQWIAHYIKQVMPSQYSLSIDYALISHFHSDHYGKVRKSSKTSQTGAYLLTGITQVADLIPIRKLIDRGAPDYSFPVDMRTYHTKIGGDTFLNYLNFVNYRVANKLSVEGFRPGDDNQIALLFDPKRYPTFKVQNISCNGIISSGKGKTTQAYLDAQSILNEKEKFNENPLSLALKISYGDFDYFTGGDLTGLQGYGLTSWFDVETPVAKAVGAVEVMTLNHHGNRDATNHNFVKTLDPQVAVQQSWCSDHPGQEVFHRLGIKRANGKKRDIFATNIHQETKVTLGPWFTKAYKSMDGHIVIRVSPGGSEYFVYVLNDDEIYPTIKNKFGPYKSEK